MSLVIKIENKKKENKRQKELEVHLRCVILRINTDEKDLRAYDGLGKIQTFIKRWWFRIIKRRNEQTKSREKIINRKDFKKIATIRI